MAKKLPRKRLTTVYVVALLLMALGGFVLKKTYLEPCANPGSCEESLKLAVNNGEDAVFNGQTITPPLIDLQKEEKIGKNVLSETTSNENKQIYVDLSTQTLTAMEGDQVFMQVPVSTGKWGKTPTGEFRIWTKIRAAKMSGGSGASYYYLPNVPYIMFFEGSGIGAGRGFALHGAYWHNNFGHTMSHGCVNMRTIDAEKLFNWVGPNATGARTLSTDENPGTKITIYGKSPN
jgi:lipoprotein-anchoring transpeptidase ErfK/SrfK